MSDTREDAQLPGDPIEKRFIHHPLIPYDPSVINYLAFGDVLLPFEYTNWMDEVMSWKEGAYISHSLNPQPTWRIKGPEAVKFLSRVLVNNFENWPVGSNKHAIMCNEEGFDQGDGVMLRLAEDEFISYEMGANYIAYVFEREKHKYNAVAQDLTGTVFLYQIAGPRSLEILEATTGDDLHDIRFMHHRKSSVGGVEVNVVRVGMAGTLAYELHGPAEHGRTIYNRVLEAGRPFGLKRIGFRTYVMNHTEDGFPQAFTHFPHPWVEDAEFVAWAAQRGAGGRLHSVCRGSMGPDLRLRYRTPVELGWANRIAFNHDFVGRAALEKEVENPRRKMVTLVWNAEDILDVVASKFRPGEMYANIDTPTHLFYDGNAGAYFADQVLKDGKWVGVSSGRTYSLYYREMLSLCSIDVEHGELGNEVVILWGDPGTRQKLIRATVSRFPYLNEARNEDFDVNLVPRPLPRE